MKAGWKRWITWGIGLMALVIAVLGTEEGWPWYLSAVALLGMGTYVLLTLYEHFAMDARAIALVATLSAVASVGRAVVQGIPDIQPATFLIIMSGFSLGPRAGAAVGAFTAIGSNLFLGEGGWTPWQMLAWGMVGFLAGWLRRFKPGMPVRWLIPFGILSGYVFGWTMNTWSLLTSGPATWKAYLALDAASFLGFDTVHAVATSLYIAVAGAAVFRVLERFRRRLIPASSAMQVPEGIKYGEDA